VIEVAVTMTLPELLTECTRDGRVCPMPPIWGQLWEMLPERRWVGEGWNPPLPLMLIDWCDSSDAEKRGRFHSHLRWAADHGSLDAVARAISAMKPQDWHTER
jgi:hypothetical protein